jgi:hypothetical protein
MLNVDSKSYNIWFVLLCLLMTFVNQISLVRYQSTLYIVLREYFKWNTTTITFAFATIGLLYLTSGFILMNNVKLSHGWLFGGFLGQLFGEILVVLSTGTSRPVAQSLHP